MAYHVYHCLSQTGSGWYPIGRLLPKLQEPTGCSAILAATVASLQQGNQGSRPGCPAFLCLLLYRLRHIHTPPQALILSQWGYPTADVSGMRLALETWVAKGTAAFSCVEPLEFLWHTRASGMSILRSSRLLRGYHYTVYGLGLFVASLVRELSHYLPYGMAGLALYRDPTIRKQPHPEQSRSRVTNKLEHASGPKP